MTTDADVVAAPPEPGAAHDYAVSHGLSRTGARQGLVEYSWLLWRRRHFIVAYARARNAAAYTESVLGQFWQVLTPLLNVAVYYLVFGLLLHTRSGVHNFIAFLVAGVFIFNYTQRAALSGAAAVTSRLSLVRALHFPRATLPLATTLIELQQLLFSTLVLAVIIVASGEPVTSRWLLMFPILLLQTVFNAGVALVFARLTVRVRDLQQLLPFLLRTLQYLSGVFYSIAVFAKRAPYEVRLLLKCNPIAVYIELVRGALLDGYAVPAHTWSLAVGWALSVFAFGYVYFWRAEESYGRG